MASKDKSLEPVGNPYLVAVMAWIVPGAGHLYLRRPIRAAIFFGLVIGSLLIGMALHGNLYRAVSGQPLTMLAMLASMGMGTPYFVARFGLDYSGDLLSPGYEYGSAFILTAGLMNLLLILDSWDISRGAKE